MAKSSGQKLKLIYLKDYLLRSSDAEHPVSINDMIAHLAARGISAERKSLYDDISELQLYGLDIERTKGKTTGYYVASREFQMPELKLLVDAVQSSRFITQKKTMALIKKIHDAGMKAGLSIKPKTPWEVVKPFIPYLDLVLVMSVEPGFGGQKYMPESTDRIRAIREEAKRTNPALRVEVDGGIKTNNVKVVLDAGADMIVAGSAVLGGDDVLEKTRAFMEILRG